MPRSYASDLLIDDIDLPGERIGGRPFRSGRRRSDLFMLILAAAASGGFLVNALMFQGGRHVPKPASAPGELRQIPTPAAAPAPSAPAPTAASSAPATPLPAASADTAPAAAEPLSLAPAAPLPPTKPAVIPRKPAPVAAAPAAPAAASATATPSGMVPPADIGVSARVMEVQKALARLGYGPISIDGRTGEATREAIERFERDRQLPVTGQVSDQLVRELNAIAGLSIR